MESDQLRYPYSMTRFFVPEFISRMRRRGEVSDKPSPRQSKAMCDLLLPAYLRKGYLSFGDLVEIAVSTSRVENQALAERLAYEILLDVDEAEDEAKPEGDDAFLGLLSEKSDDLVSYLPTEVDELGQGEPKAVYDSDVELFREFTGKPDLGVGPGEDELLKMAIRKYKSRRDERSRRRLAEHLKVKLLKLGRDFQMSAEANRKPILRPFERGDDPNDIDEDRSMENIFDQGKRMDEVGYGDFFIRKKNRRKRSIVYILDISNTMFYELDGLTSIHYSVLSLVPLLWSLRKESFGLIMYESNSHVQKSIHEDGDVDDIVDDLLVLVTSTTAEVEKSIRGTRGTRTWGGTIPTTSLRWALRQLEESDARTDRICFYFSDFVLQDPGDKLQTENYEIIGRMVEQGIRVVACVSPLARGKIFSPYTRETLLRVEAAGAEVIETSTPSGFLEGLQAFLDNL
jgi:hypothetical protein